MYRKRKERTEQETREDIRQIAEYISHKGPPGPAAAYGCLKVALIVGAIYFLVALCLYVFGKLANHRPIF
jgi:hypothetical protein